jgi:hypothetical protein
MELFDEEQKIKYNEVQKIDRKEIILDLISKLTFSLDDIKHNSITEDKKELKKIKRENLLPIISSLVIGDNKFFNKYNCLLFGLSKKTIKTEIVDGIETITDSSVKSFLGAINGIINNYGLEIITYNHKLRDKNTKNFFYDSYYYIKINQDFYNYLQIDKSIDHKKYNLDTNIIDI